ncbi:hypothetical protein [Salisediminibacterium selenitireducens]|uniref:Uncharacterized protein n=1 Tax=Bacillus selenitireducens (strain ATCC 700615 / DSM 15326 / MLS10) TaxID=439292 RepID=D6XT92_BACIE|nr:hypothetical protein [Salisediminibacterium selenitireducens]ADH99028.1 hypothetical protein Bsel_1516 [[Bacillus] selenitireducens MLS10]
MKQNGSEDIHSETVIAWGRFEITDSTIRSFYKENGLPDDNAILESEKERWKTILIEAGIFSFVKKRLDRLFRELFDMTAHPATGEQKNEQPGPSVDSFLDRWLIRPHAGTYKARFQQATPQEQIHMRKRALNELRLHTHHPGAARTLYQLYVFHEAIDEGVAHWYRHTMTNQKFTTEELQFLGFLADLVPETAVKLILQTIDIQAEVQKPHTRSTIPPLLKRLFQCVDEEEADRLIAVYKSRFAHRKSMLELIL